MPKIKMTLLCQEKFDFMRKSFVIVFWLFLSCFNNALSRTRTSIGCVYAELEVNCISKSISGPLN